MNSPVEQSQILKECLMIHSLYKGESIGDTVTNTSKARHKLCKNGEKNTA